MTIVDQRATRMWKGFSRKPNFRPYDALMPKVIPFGAEGAPTNAPTAPLATVSSEVELRGRGRDAGDPAQRGDLEVRRRAAGRTMPAPRHDYIIGSQPADAGG